MADNSNTEDTSNKSIKEQLVAAQLGNTTYYYGPKDTVVDQTGRPAPDSIAKALLAEKSPEVDEILRKQAEPKPAKPHRDKQPRSASGRKFKTKTLLRRKQEGTTYTPAQAAWAAARGETIPQPAEPSLDPDEEEEEEEQDSSTNRSSLLGRVGRGLLSTAFPDLYRIGTKFRTQSKRKSSSQSLSENKKVKEEELSYSLENIGSNIRSNGELIREQLTGQTRSIFLLEQIADHIKHLHSGSLLDNGPNMGRLKGGLGLGKLGGMAALLSVITFGGMALMPPQDKKDPKPVEPPNDKSPETPPSSVVIPHASHPLSPTSTNHIIISPSITPPASTAPGPSRPLSAPTSSNLETQAVKEAEQRSPGDKVIPEFTLNADEIKLMTKNLDLEIDQLTLNVSGSINGASVGMDVSGNAPSRANPQQQTGDQVINSPKSDPVPSPSGDNTNGSDSPASNRPSLIPSSPPSSSNHMTRSSYEQGNPTGGNLSPSQDIGGWLSSKSGDPRGMIPVLRAAAIANGLDPDKVVKVAEQEGLSNPIGDHKTSFGALQLHYGGLGTEFQRATGLDPSLPKNEAAGIAWAVHYAAQHGWLKSPGGGWSSVENGLAPDPGKGTPSKDWHDGLISPPQGNAPGPNAGPSGQQAGSSNPEDKAAPAPASQQAGSSNPEGKAAPAPASQQPTDAPQSDPSPTSRLPSMSSKYTFGTNKPPAGAGVIGSGFDWFGRENRKDLERVHQELPQTPIESPSAVPVPKMAPQIPAPPLPVTPSQPNASGGPQAAYSPPQPQPTSRTQSQIPSSPLVAVAATPQDIQPMRKHFFPQFSTTSNNSSVGIAII